MSETKASLEVIEFLIDKYHKFILFLYTWGGLIICQIVINIIFLRTSLLIKSHYVLEDTYFHFLSNINYIFLSHIILSALIFGVWLFRRRIPKIPKNRSGILFAPYCNKYELSEELAHLESLIRQDIITKDFSKAITVKRLPPNHKPGSHETNVKFIKKAKAKVLFSGNFDSYTKQGKRYTGFRSVQVTCIDLPFSPHEVPYALNDALYGRIYSWSQDDTISSTKVALSFGQISRYLTGLTLYTHALYIEACQILGPLTAEIDSQYNSRKIPREIHRFKSTLKNAYLLAIINSVKKKYSKKLESEEIFTIPESILNEWNQEIDLALKIDPFNKHALSIRCILLFLLKKIPEAKGLIKLSSSKHAGDINYIAICNLNEAFLLAYEGNLRDAKKLYKKVFTGKHIPEDKTLFDILSFQGMAIDAYPSNLELRFLFALLNEEIGNKDVAINEYKEFINMSRKDKINERLCAEAELRINRIAKT